MKLSRDLKNRLRPLIPSFLLIMRKKIKRNKRVRKWEKIGSPIPPPDSYKQLVVEQFQKKFGYGIFVETGTYLGDMVEAQKHNFKKIYSVEIGLELYNRAKKRFERDMHIDLKLGDSGIVLAEILNEVNEPAIFWLDGHYSGGFTAKGEKECPIIEEINSIFKKVVYNHVLLIDDARCFNGKGDYPSVQKLSDHILNYNKNYLINIEKDIIRCVVD